MKDKAGLSEKIYRLHISLRDMPVPVWRTLLVPAKITLPRLHRAIQAVMPWRDYHLYVFEVGGRNYTGPDTMDELGFEDADGVRLFEVASRVGTHLLYEYDFGDCWLHDIKVEAILTPDQAAVQAPALPACVAGERACPPEDCGGPYGYERLLEALSNPSHEDHDDVKMWSGGDFDPEALDLTAANLRLRPKEYWRDKRPSVDTDLENLPGLWFGYADDDFIEELEDTRTAATVKKYREALELFITYMKIYHPGRYAWPQIQASDFLGFAGYFLPHHVMPRAGKAVATLSALNGFSKWLDREYGTSLQAAFAPAHKRYKRALPNALDAADLLAEFGYHQRRARMDVKPALTAEGMWKVRAVEAPDVILASDDVVLPKGAGTVNDISVRMPLRVTELLKPDFTLFLALRRDGEEWTVDRVGAVLPD